MQKGKVRPGWKPGWKKAKRKGPSTKTPITTSLQQIRHNPPVGLGNPEFPVSGGAFESKRSRH